MKLNVYYSLPLISIEYHTIDYHWILLNKKSLTVQQLNLAIGTELLIGDRLIEGLKRLSSRHLIRLKFNS